MKAVIFLPFIVALNIFFLIPAPNHFDDFASFFGSINCFTSLLSCSIAVDCCNAMELRVAVIVGSLAREDQAKVPTTS